MDGLKYNSDKLLARQDGDWNKVWAHYNVTEEYEKECIEKLRHWYIHQPHLPQIELENIFFARNLATKAYRVENTKELIDNYFTSRLMFPEILQNRDPLSDEVIKSFRQQTICPFPKLTAEGYRVMLFRKIGPEWNIINALKACTMIAEYLLMNDNGGGIHMIFYCDPLSLSDVVQFTPTLIYKMIFLITACMGAKLKGAHLVKLPSFAVSVVKLFKKMLKTKLAQRIHLYENIDEVQEIIPKSMFPSDYGGNEPPTYEITELLLKTLQTAPWRNWFLEQEKVVTDESKRITKTTKFDDTFGVEGNFRNISID